MTLSESARVMTTAEARFRIPYPNALPRRGRIVALDRESEQLLGSLQCSGARAEMFRLVHGLDGARAHLAGQTGDLSIDEGLDDVDVVLVVAHAGSTAGCFEQLALACRQRSKFITACVIDAADREDLRRRTLASLRAHASMIVVSRDAGYLEDMLSALRV